MFIRALYTLLLRLLSDVSGGNGDGEEGDDKGTGDDKGEAQLKEKASGDERGILDHLQRKGEEGDEEKGEEDDKKGEAEDGKPPKLVFKEKPDWVPAKFYDEKTGEVKVEELAKNEKYLRDKVSKGEDKAPAEGKDYKLELADDLKPIEARALLDGEDDPLKVWYRGIAKEKGWSEADATDVYSGFLRIAGDLLGEPIDPKVVVKNLGPNGLAILKHTQDFGDNLLKLGVLNQDEHDAVMSWFQDETDVRAFQKMREFYGEKAPPMAAVVPEGSSSRAELRGKIADLMKRADGGDQTVQAEYEKLQEEYKKTYGEEPAGTSLQG